MNFLPAVEAPLVPSSRAWIFAFAGAKLVWSAPPTGAGDDLPDFTPEAWPAFESLAPDRHHLGRLDGVDCWALALREAPAGRPAVSLRTAMMRLPAPLAALAGRAAQVLEWDRTHRFCGVCATPTVPQRRERSRRCPSCGQTVYPRLSPAMMALVWRGDELLLARSPHYPPGMFSALAGFVEAGESLEDCVVREVIEEVGVGISDLRYYGSQSWPFPNSLMVAYTARWTGGEIVPQPDEIEAAAWFRIDDLPAIPPRFSIAGHLIRDTAAALAAGRDLTPAPDCVR